MKQVFQTHDGKTFIDKEEAEKHEAGLFESWLKSDPHIPVNVLLGIMSDEDGQAWQGWTDRNIIRHYLKRYWELMKPEPRFQQNEFNITGSAILLRLKELGLPVPDSAKLVVRIPGGGDWSNTDFELNEEPLIVRSK